MNGILKHIWLPVVVMLAMLLSFLPVSAQGQDPEVIYGDLEWELVESQMVGVLQVCRDGIRYIHWAENPDLGSISILLDGDSFMTGISNALSIQGAADERPGFWDAITTNWPRQIEPGRSITVKGGEVSKIDHRVEDCFLDPRNQPNQKAEPPLIEFSADASRIQAGHCATLRWNVENVQAVWVYPQGGNYSKYGVVGQGNRKECPKTTTTYEMRVLLRNNEVELRQVRVELEAAPATEPATGNTTANTTTSPQTAPPAATRETARVNSALEVRAGPGADRIVIAKLQRGETFYVQARDETGKWLLLVIPGTPDGLGWVATQAVALSTSIQNIPVYSVRGQATTPANNEQSAEQPPAPSGVVTPITGFETWGTWTRGDERWGAFAQDSKQVHGGRFAGRFDYDFPANVPNNYVVYRSVLPIKGQPQALEVWVYGDGSQHFLNAWVQDAKGQLWQFGFGRVNHTGWQRMVAPLDLSRGWPNQAVGGSATTQVTYPLKFYAFVLDAYADDKAFKGAIYLDDLAGVDG